MLNIPQFQRVAKDFRAGKLDIQEFTRLLYGATKTESPSNAEPTAGPATATGPATSIASTVPPAGTVGSLTGPPLDSDVAALVPTAPGSALPSPANTAADNRPTKAGSLGGADHRPVTAVERLDLDLARVKRCGFSEVIFGPGKTLADLTTAAQRLLSERQNVLITRVAEPEAQGLLRQFPVANYNPTARTVRIAAGSQAEPQFDSERPVAVLTAGTGDIPIAEEAAETLRWMGVEPRLIYDVGVAGPHRLLKHVDFLRTCLTVIVVAGMEGALPSVVGGHVSCPVVAVPTSLGYGAHFQGLVPLLGMINSCAANVVVVNIDAGFKGGYLAGLIVNQINASVSARQAAN